MDERAFTILMALAPGASDAFGVTGPSSRMMWVNPAFERMTGHRLTG
jgi:PAS domain-containing protein